MKSIAQVDYSKFKSRMSEYGMRGKDLANMLGLADTTVNRWLREGLPMPGECLRVIAKHFRMSGYEIADELLGLKQKTYEPSAEEILKAFAAHLRKDF